MFRRYKLTAYSKKTKIKVEKNLLKNLQYNNIKRSRRRRKIEHSQNGIKMQSEDMLNMQEQVEALTKIKIGEVFRGNQIHPAKWKKSGGSK